MNSSKEIAGNVQSISKWNFDYPLIKLEEGSTKFWMVPGEVYTAPAFFNPVMSLNRDATILFSKLLAQQRGRKLRILEPLSGIGLRAIRLIQEIPEYISSVTINDFENVTSSLAAYNRHHFDATSRIIQYKREARSLLSEFAEKSYKFQLIDLDPFGSPSQYLDFLWRPLQNKSIVCVTATDMTALCGVFPQASLRKYGALSYNNHHTHETAARILIASVVRSAARFNAAVFPIFTLSSHHYLKIFFLKIEGSQKTNAQVAKIKLAASCNSCQNFAFLDSNEKMLCCGKIKYFGPLWSENIFDSSWCENGISGLNTMNLPGEEQLKKHLHEGTISNLPMYYAIEKISSKFKINTPKSSRILNELRSVGYRAEVTCYRRQAIRTNANGIELEKIVTQIAKEIR